MDLPQYANFPLSASAPFLYFNGGIDSLFGHLYEPMVMDARTRATYRFPVFSSSLDAVMRREPHPWWPGLTVLSGEYIVVFRPWQHWNPPTTLIQAFVAPDSSARQSDTDMGQLLLTHEALVEYCYAPTHALRGAIVDPATGVTNIRCLSTYTHREQTHYFCVDITIPPINSGSTEVLPMFVNAQELLVLPGQREAVFLDASDDGHGRGILTLSLSEYLQLSDYPLALYKVSIDASGEQCTAAVSEPSILTRQDVFQYTDSCVFDGVRGRFCHDLEARYRRYDLVVLGLH
ncbi:hypothetical protein J3R83DRAFT_9383 [Lanmaoa asiatica]|nr:hypothetical protein J3R83DRAFT_9383 [Lanmaoa asiatica]